METVIVGLVGLMFISIIGVYVWTFKISQNTNEQLGKIYNTVNKHIQKADIHTKKQEFVDSDVCEERHKAITGTLQEIKMDVKCLLSKL